MTQQDIAELILDLYRLQRYCESDGSFVRCIPSLRDDIVVRLRRLLDVVQVAK